MVSESPLAPSRPGGGRALRTTLEAVAAAVGLLVAIYLLGVLVTWISFTAARLPGDAGVSALGTGQLFGAGLRSAIGTTAAFAVLCALAYLTATFRWDVNGQDWHDIVRRGGVRNARDRRPVGERDRRQSARTRHRHEALAAGFERISARAGSRPRLRHFANRRVHRHHDEAQAAAAPAPQPPKLAPLGDGAVRIIAGFNLLIVAGLLSLWLADRLVAILPTVWNAALGSSVLIVGWLVFFIALHQLLTRLDPLAHPWAHVVVWLFVAVGALFCSAPFGVLVLTGVAIATLGRRLARLSPPSGAGELLRSPLPWILLGIVALLSLAYHAIPPVSFPGATVTTASTTLSGGYLSRSPQGVYLATCTPLADATSIDERLRFVPAADVRTVAIGGPTANFDSGERPSLVTLGLRALGVGGAVTPLFDVALHAQRGTCRGVAPSRLTDAREDPALGAGVMVEAPSGPPMRAAEDETPIATDHATPATVPAGRATPPAVAALALRYQPTLLVSAADRFWPVSVNALLEDRGPGNGPTCLMQHRSAPICGAALSAGDLTRAGALPSDYLQFPVRLTHDADGIGQFKSLESGQYVSTGPLHRWLADPGVLQPWRTGQIYFYLGPTVSLTAFPTPRATDPEAPASERFIPLEYWFYYPFNYFPLLATDALMNAAPLAGDKLNVDLHQGDWEHIDVLLDATTLAPKWLYMARHSSEGQFLQWGSPVMAMAGGHAVVQAAFGGHPTYEPGCGSQVRHQPTSALEDWLVCGGGRFAFPAATTPLVDIAQQPWVCWPGHFGAAGTRDEINSVGKNESALDSVRGQVFVAGPQAPARQAENTGACPDASAPELRAASLVATLSRPAGRFHAKG